MNISENAPIPSVLLTVFEGNEWDEKIRKTYPLTDLRSCFY